MVRQTYRKEHEPIFVYNERSPVQANVVCRILRLALETGGLNPSHYSFHSLRAGRTGDLAKLQVPISKIGQIGRWKSNAVYKYLKGC